MLLSVGIRLIGFAGLLLLAGMLVVCQARQSFSSPAPLMRLDPAVIKVDGGAGTGFTVDVVIEGVADLGAFEFEIDFDRSFVKLDAIERGPFLGSTGRLVTCQQVSMGSHVEKLGCESQGPVPRGPDGSGVVASIHFFVQGHSFGETRLILRSCGAANVLGNGLVDNDACKRSKLTINPPTPTPNNNPGMQKLPSIQNLFLTRQGQKIPPLTCTGGSDTAVFHETLSVPILPAPDPKDPAHAQELGAFEFEVHYDDRKVCVELLPGPAASGMICIVKDSVITPALEGVARLGCLTAGKTVFPNTTTAKGRHLADIIVRPQPDVYSQAKPNQDNGVVVQLNDVGCELADLQGHPIKLSSCADADVTIRYLEGDVHPDCKVDALDTQAVAFRWGAEKGSLIYEDFINVEPSGPQADNDIDIKDLQFVYGRFASTCSHPHPPQPPANPKGPVQTPTLTPTPMGTPTPTPTEPAKPRINKSPNLQHLFLASPPQTEFCEDSQDSVSFEVVIKDSITSFTPKTPPLPQQLGAFEFETHFDPALVCVEITPGEIPSGEMSCLSTLSPDFVRFGCVTPSKQTPPFPQPPGVLAVVTVRPQPGVYTDLFPGQEIVTQLLNENCQLADLQGHSIKAGPCAGATLVISYP